MWLSAWSDDPLAGRPRLRDRYLAVYGVLGALSAVFICLATLVTAVHLPSLLFNTLLA